MAGDQSSSSFTTGNIAQEKGLDYVPGCYKVSSPNHPSLARETTLVPVIDMARLRQDGGERSVIIREIGDAFHRSGFFQVSFLLIQPSDLVNHGICQEILDGALASALGFFNLPAQLKLQLKSDDVFKAVRYGGSFKDGVDKVQFWRVFLKHYSYPLDTWIDSWPKNPPQYREKMGNFSTEIRKLALELMKVITESLGLGRNYQSQKMEDGMQVITVNCHPPCPQPSLALGLPPHSDYSSLTILLQNSPGLEIGDSHDCKWRLVPELHGALQIL
ncbi:hypothetical protein SLEP1_g52570 [Rubroshorea leprosula]|uniref:Flavanone 3-hydroxylase n=1 Tax=Rubroshorea leprosula TaxID=152421 RepID=A0AAV5M9D4_9ROSI|nr:hypothetical protein SLEP1_g52570 [Rubroshorea leprosula]